MGNKQSEGVRGIARRTARSQRADNIRIWESGQGPKFLFDRALSCPPPIVRSFIVRTDPSFDAAEVTERFFTVIKSLNEFDKVEIRGVIQTLISPTQRDICLPATIIGRSPMSKRF